MKNLQSDAVQRKYSTIAEALRTEDMGYSIEEYRHEVIRDKAQAGNGEPIAINMSLVACLRIVDIKLGKCGLEVKRITN